MKNITCSRTSFPVVSFTTTLTLLLLNGCATLNVQKEEVEKSKKVAVVGCSGVQDVRVTPMFAFGSKDKSYIVGMNSAVRENREHAQLI